MSLFYLITTIIFMAPSLWSMNPIVTLKDNTNTTAAITDMNTVHQLRTLSSTFAQRPLEEFIEQDKKVYVILTGLPKRLISFLLELNANKKSGKLFIALANQGISLADITRNNIEQLSLAQPFNQVFENLIILETTSDNQYTPLKKNIIAPFFTTIDELIEDFQNQFIIPIAQITKQNLVQLYKLIYDISKPISFVELTKTAQYIGHKVRDFKTAELLALLEAANFLGAKSVILTGLFDLYKARFPKIDDWQKELQAHPFLEDIAFEVEHNEQYPSIELLLKQGNKDFYSIKMEPSAVTNQNILTAHIKGPKVCFLKGLNTIPDILNCQALYIEDTSINTLKTDDLKNLNKLKEIVFSNNSNLAILEANSLRKFDVRFLKIKGSNISILTPGVFILNQLKALTFENNHLNTIAANWALSLPNVTSLALDEPELKTLEPGWLNGLQKLSFFEVSPDISPTLDAQIKNTLAAYPQISYIKPGAL